MSDDNSEKQSRGRLSALWQSLWQRPQSRWLLGIPLGAVVFFVGGILFWGAYNTAMELSNKEAFCISCHEMHDFVYEEYKKTIHYNNRTGVRATCSDCHVPKEWVHKFVRKIKATNELFHKIIGTINTREKFEAHRLQLAEHVWDTMKSTNSRECRNCHALEFMDLEKQDKSARKKHSLERQEKGETCIDCHKGIAHKLPEGYATLDKSMPAPHRVATAPPTEAGAPASKD